MRAKVNGVEIFFDVHGRGLRPEGTKLVEKPAMFVLHGGPGFDHSQFPAWMEALTENFQIIYMDHRGNGRSSRPAVEECTLEAQADDLEALRQLLGLGKVLVLGVSYGGMLALTYGVRHPDSISHLIATVTTPSHAFREEAEQIARERGTPEQQEIAHICLTGTFKDAEHLATAFPRLRPLYYYRFDPKYETTASWTIANVEMINWFFAHGVNSYDLRPRLHEIKAPTLVITGRHDWICPPSQSAQLVRGIPDVRQVMFEYSGHQVMKEENEKFVRVVREFGLTGEVTSEPTIRR